MWEPEPALRPWVSNLEEDLLRERDLTHDAVFNSDLNDAEKLCWLKLCFHYNFPSDLETREHATNRAELGSLFQCSEDTVSNRLTALKSTGAIRIRYEYVCPVCDHREEHFFKTCAACLERGKSRTQLYITILGLPVTAPQPTAPKPDVAFAEPDLRHDRCEYRGPASQFAPFRRCPYCGSYDDPDHFTICPKVVPFRRGVPVPRDWPLASANRVEKDDVKRWQQEQAYQQQQTATGTGPTGPTPNRPPLALVPPNPPDTRVSPLGAIPPTPAPPPPAHGQSPSSHMSASGVLGAAAPSLDAPPLYTVHEPESENWGVWDQRGHYQCSCGSRVVIPYQGTLACMSCKRVLWVLGEGGEPKMPEGP